MANPILLSVVATSRNDNHGKNLLYRMQHFVDGFVAQCKKHELRAELILVEWNPPEQNPSLATTLQFPQDKGPCTIRIIQVPSELHKKLDHADKIPLFQMIAKNVGIRRAQGEFILATNIDILFSDKLMQFLKLRLQSGILYRVDRLDVPEQLPNTKEIEKILDFCAKNYFRINGKYGTQKIEKAPFSTKIKKLPTVLYRGFFSMIRKIFSTSIKGLIDLLSTAVNFILNITLEDILRFVLRDVFYRLSKPLVRSLLPGNSFFLHTNACGDFTLLSKTDWENLKGYPEWNIFSWHLDSVLLYQAKQHGIREKDLPLSLPIYHIEHEIGSGYSAEGANALFTRLKSKGIPYLSNQDLKNLTTEMKNSREKIIYNREDWGLGSILLKEFVP